MSTCRKTSVWCLLRASVQPAPANLPRQPEAERNLRDSLTKGANSAGGADRAVSRQPGDDRGLPVIPGAESESVTTDAGKTYNHFLFPFC